MSRSARPHGVAAFALGALLALPLMLAAPAAAQAQEPAGLGGGHKDKKPGVAQVKAWGDNLAGQLGDATFTSRNSAVTTTGLTGVRQLASGGVHTLAVLNNSTVQAWGSNAQSQLGDGSNVNHPTPGAVPGLTGVSSASAGGNHSLVLLANGTLKAWGSNAFGQVGTGSLTPEIVRTPVDVVNVTGAQAVAAGSRHSLALLRNGTVMAWGLNNVGQLGTGAFDDGTATPVLVPGLSGVRAIAAHGDFSLALLRNGTVMAWGDNADGQLGIGSLTPEQVATPTPVVNLTGVKAISAGSSFSLALLNNGTVRSWGDNGFGQLGTGSLTPERSPSPVNVTGLTGVRSIDAGGQHAVALLRNGTVMTWGDGRFGQMGNGTNTAENPTPLAVVTGLPTVRLVAAGGFFSLAAS